MDSKSLERLDPDDVAAEDVTGRQTLELHLARYEFAAAHARAGRLLDMACGAGYGTRLVADRAPVSLTCLGVDLSADAIALARQRYGRPGVEFRVADAMRFEDPDGFDTIVSLETIEHLPDPERFVARLPGLLREEGLLVCSVPTTPSVDANPHHLHDFTERSFRRLVGQHGFVEVDRLEQVQPFHPLPLLQRREARARDLRKNLPLYYLGHPASLVRRLVSTLRHGFANHYLTIAWRRREGGGGPGGRPGAPRVSPG